MQRSYTVEQVRELVQAAVQAAVVSVIQDAVHKETDIQRLAALRKVDALVQIETEASIILDLETNINE